MTSVFFANNNSNQLALDDSDRNFSSSRFSIGESERGGEASSPEKLSLLAKSDQVNGRRRKKRHLEESIEDLKYVEREHEKIVTGYFRFYNVLNLLKRPNQETSRDLEDLIQRVLKTIERLKLRDFTFNMNSLAEIQQELIHLKDEFYTMGLGDFKLKLPACSNIFPYDVALKVSGGCEMNSIRNPLDKMVDIRPDLQSLKRPAVKPSGASYEEAKKKYIQATVEHKEMSLKIKEIEKRLKNTPKKDAARNDLCTELKESKIRLEALDKDIRNAYRERSEAFAMRYKANL